MTKFTPDWLNVVFELLGATLAAFAGGGGFWSALAQRAPAVFLGPLAGSGNDRKDLPQKLGDRE